MVVQFIPPQLAKAAATCPAGDRWLFQPKYDGHRVQVHLTGATAQLMSRRGHDRTALFPRIVPYLHELGIGDAIIDGEVCVMDNSGRSDFGALCKSLGTDATLSFVAFDLLSLNSRDLRALPLVERLRRLSSIIPVNGPVCVAETTTDGAALLERVRLANGEGIVAKLAAAPYRTGQRSDEWLKIKLKFRQEFTLVGWHEDQNGTMKSVVLATAGKDGFEYRGCVGSGFTRSQRQDLKAAMAGRQSQTAPFPRTGGIRRDVRWTEPCLIAEIEFSEITSAGSVRHPRFLGLRDDKDPSEIILEAS